MADASFQEMVIPGGTIYQTVDYSEFQGRMNPDLFHDERYNEILVEMIRLTLKLEAPIAEDLLIQRIARAHDFKRTGRLICERVLMIVDEHFHLRQDPIDGSFVWLHEGGPGGIVNYRVPMEGQPGRSIEEIPSEEIVAVARFAGADCSPVQIARILGNKRLTNSGKERIERAIGSIQNQTGSFPE